ncbi:hypothetical protein BC940DRAFT_100145 [Gongronella butleri]|nr:hypothetical protein BC940DRAFT_100145 [Gongronella butleri]
MRVCVCVCVFSKDASVTKTIPFLRFCFRRDANTAHHHPTRHFFKGPSVGLLAHPLSFFFLSLLLHPHPLLAHPPFASSIILLFAAPLPSLLLFLSLFSLVCSLVCRPGFSLLSKSPLVFFSALFLFLFFSPFFFCT